MKEERDVVETDQPAEENKAKKYIQNSIGGVLMALILLTCVMAVLRRCGI
jgi:hypothetical protein